MMTPQPRIHPAILAGAAAALLLASPHTPLLSAAAAQPGTNPTPTPTAGRVDLRPKFKQGQRIRYTMHLDSVTDVKSPQLPELDQKQLMRQQLDLTVHVIDAGTDGATIELIYDRVKVSLASDAFSAEYDSANPPRQSPKSGTPKAPKSPGTAPPGETPAAPTDILNLDDPEFFAAAMKGIAGTVVTINLDASGNITSVSGTASLTPGGGIPGIGGAGGGSWLVSSPGQSGYARIGETWTTTSALGNTPLGNFTMVTNYTLRSAAAGRATITISGGIDAGSGATSPSTTPGSSGGTQIRDSKYSGTYTWDLGAGQIREMQTTQSATIEGNSMGVPMTMRSSTDVRVKRSR